MAYTFLIIILVVIVAGFVAMFLVFRSLTKKKESDATSVSFLQNQINEISRTLDLKLSESTRQMNDSVRHQFNQSQKLIQDVNDQMVRHLTNVSKGMIEANESSKQVFTIAEKLQDLEKVLKNQKQRGNLGEASLELILSNILPATAYKLQYRFKDNDIVDAVVITKDGVIPIDAKFSLDNYSRLVNEDDEDRKKELEKDFKNDLKKRIDETAKYIKPKESTLPFAFMFIPAEGIYYDLLVNEVGSVKVNTRSLIDYAYKDKNVIIVSPTTFAAYLQSVLYGFRAFKIEESAKQIGKQVENLLRHLKSYDTYFNKVGNSLSTTISHYNSASKEFGKIDKDILKITGDGIGTEQMILDKPKEEE